MTEPPYRALRIFLRVFSLLAVAGGLLMIFAGKPLIVRIFLRPPEGEVTTLLLSLLKEMGGIVESAQAFHKCARFCNAATAQDASSHVASALVGVDEENFLVIENRATPKWWWLVHSSREGGKSREMEKARAASRAFGRYSSIGLRAAVARIGLPAADSVIGAWRPFYVPAGAGSCVLPASA